MYVYNWTYMYAYNLKQPFAASSFRYEVIYTGAICIVKESINIYWFQMFLVFEKILI